MLHLTLLGHNLALEKFQILYSSNKKNVEEENIGKVLYTHSIGKTFYDLKSRRNKRKSYI